MNIAIIDDNQNDLEEIRNDIEKFYGGGTCSIDSYARTDDFLSSLKSHSYDLIFLDIILEDENGIKNFCSDCKKAYDIDRENEKILSDQNENVKGKKEYDWYSSLEQLETFIDDPEQYLVRVQIVFAYKKNDKKVSSEITAHRIEITDTLRNFFSKQTRESLKPINEKPLRLEILRLMNANIMENQKILDVRFTKLEVLQK